MHTRRPLLIGLLALIAITAVGPGPSHAQGPIKIGLVQGLTGPFEVYAKQAVTGFKLGLEYATGGKLEVLGRKIEVLVEDDQLKPDVAKRLVTKLYGDDKVDLVVGHDQQRRRPGHPPRRRGVQEGPGGRAGGGRQHHRRVLEPLRLPHRPELRAGRDRQRPRGGEARGADRHDRPGLRLRPGRRGGVQGGGREARRQGGPGGVHAAGRDGLHGAHPEDRRRAEGQAGPQVRLRHLGGQGRPLRPARREPPRQVRHHAHDAAATCWTC